MSGYRDLVYGAAVEYGNADQDALRAMERALSFVFRTLETVTPEMVLAWVGDRTPDEIAFPTDREYASGSWLAMLRTSPLAPPKEQIVMMMLTSERLAEIEAALERAGKHYSGLWGHDGDSFQICQPEEAAALVRAAKANAALVEALRPFVAHGRACGAFTSDPGTYQIYTDTGYRVVPKDDFIAVRAALTLAEQL